MKYFTLNELIRSTTARSRAIPNIPPPHVIERLEALVDEVLDPIREAWGHPLRVNSGYRSEPLNRAVGGKPASQHLTGDAADITAGSRDANRRLFEMIRGSRIPFDQLIDESAYRWIHVSRSTRPRRQALHLK